MRVESQNSVQQFSALNAFRSNQKPVKSENIEQDKVSIGTQTQQAKSLLDKVDVSDIRKNAEYVGEFNISDEDIKYGLMYGRSVIAEFLA